MAYAEHTKVDISTTRREIEALLKRAGGTRIITMEDTDAAVVICMLAERMLKFRVPIDPKASQQIRKSRWRALLLTIKAKRESVEAGIETVEEAFLAQVVLPDGQTVAQWFEPELATAFSTGKMPSNPLMLPSPKSRDGRGS